MEGVRHNCGFCVTHSLHDAYNFIKSLQNRGREAAGIAAISQDKIDVIKWVGRATRFGLETLYELLDGSSPTFLGHVRYATTGRKEIEQLLQDAHPVAIGGERTRRGNHLIIRDARIVGVHNGQVSDQYFEGVDLGKLDTKTDTEKLLKFYDKVKEGELLKSIPGAYTLAIAEKGRKDVVIMRDRTGIKPGVLGWKDGKFVATSEDNALKENGAEFREELRPGCAYYMSYDGRNCGPIRVIDATPRHCFFEWNYIAHPASTLNDVQVRTLRRKLGEKLAEEFAAEVDPKEIDYVTFLPRCPKEAAISFSEILGRPFLPVFYKEDEERSFQGSTMQDRKTSIKRNLQLIDKVEDKIRGKRVVVIDDSTIRGNNSNRAADLLNKDAIVAKAYLLNYTPEIGIIPEDGIQRGCMFGVDMPPEESENHKFIARYKSRDQISQEIGMDVRYISSNGMLEVFEQLGMPRNKLCTFCIGGKHPFEGLEQRIKPSKEEQIVVLSINNS